MSSDPKFDSEAEMSKRQVYFVKASTAIEAMVDVGIETIGTGWPVRGSGLWMTNKTADQHQRGRFKVVCTYRRLPVIGEVVKYS